MVSGPHSNLLLCINTRHFGDSVWALWTFGPDHSVMLWSCPVHCRVVSSIPGLTPWDATSICDHKKCLQTLLNGCLEGICAKTSWLRATGLERKTAHLFHQVAKEICLLREPKFPPLSHCLSLGHSPTPDPHLWGVEFRLIESTLELGIASAFLRHETAS